MAQAANLPPTPYVGWVSTAGDDMTCRIQNRSLTNCALPPGGPTWVDMMGRTIAQGYSQLFSGTLQNKIEYTELQSQTSTNTWTGTEVTGTAATNICSAWSDDTGGGTGRKGSTLDSDLNWTAAIDGACNGILPIYCFGLN
ncbi:MAG: hypothetical protein JSR44_02485 [Spirochaetes bacterium]|nr:hypothetical protein [Spirochaetota bacterium]